MKSIILFALCIVCFYFGVSFVRTYMADPPPTQESVAKARNTGTAKTDTPEMTLRNFKGKDLQFEYLDGFSASATTEALTDGSKARGYLVRDAKGRGNCSVLEVSGKTTINAQAELIERMNKLVYAYYKGALDQFLAEHPEVSASDFRSVPQNISLRTENRVSNTTTTPSISFRDTRMDVKVPGERMIVPTNSQIQSAYREYRETGRTSTPELSQVLLFLERIELDSSTTPFFGAYALGREGNKTILIVSTATPENYAHMAEQHEALLRSFALNTVQAP